MTSEKLLKIVLNDLDALNVMGDLNPYANELVRLDIIAIREHLAKSESKPDLFKDMGLTPEKLHHPFEKLFEQMNPSVLTEDKG